MPVTTEQHCVLSTNTQVIWHYFRRFDYKATCVSPLAQLHDQLPLAGSSPRRVACQRGAEREGTCFPSLVLFGRFPALSLTALESCLELNGQSLFIKIVFCLSICCILSIHLSTGELLEGTLTTDYWTVSVICN